MFYHNLEIERGMMMPTDPMELEAVMTGPESDRNFKPEVLVGDIRRPVWRWRGLWPMVFLGALVVSITLAIVIMVISIERLDFPLLIVTLPIVGLLLLVSVGCLIAFAASS